ncbi:MAG: hypothetical protein KGK30_01385, partial [Elusimicrobia bacterium]|nr:hypothetical protein [Elusimicrobiota bacterium]
HEIAKLGPDVSTPVRLAGLVNQIKRMVTKSKGEQWCSAELEDLSGEIRLLVFPRAYASGLGQQLQVGAIVAVSGRLSFRGEGPEAAAELIVEEVAPLDFALLRYARKLRLLADPAGLEDSTLEALRRLLDDNPGHCPVVIEHPAPDGLAVLELDAKARPSQALFDGLERLLGPKSWDVETGPPQLRGPGRS